MPQLEKPSIIVEPKLKLDMDATYRELASLEIKGRNFQQGALYRIYNLLHALQIKTSPYELTPGTNCTFSFDAWDKYLNDSEERPKKRNMQVKVSPRGLFTIMDSISLSHELEDKDDIKTIDSINLQARLPQGFKLLFNTILRKLTDGRTSLLRQMLRNIPGSYEFDWTLTRRVGKSNENIPVITTYFANTQSSFFDTQVLQRYRFPLASNYPFTIPVDVRLSASEGQLQVKVYKSINAEESDDDRENLKTDRAVLLHYNLSCAEEVSGKLWQVESQRRAKTTTKVSEGLEGIKIPITTNSGEIVYMYMPAYISKEDILNRLRKGKAAVTEFVVKDIDEL